MYAEDYSNFVSSCYAYGMRQPSLHGFGRLHDSPSTQVERSHSKGAGHLPLAEVSERVRGD